MPKLTSPTILEIPYHIAGIPCVIAVTYLSHTSSWKGSIVNCPSDMDFYGYTEIEYEVLDSKGYISPWLQKKITPSINKEIENVILNTLTDN